MEQQDILNFKVDTSSLTATELSTEDFNTNLEHRLSEILSKEFYDNAEKRRIKRSPSSLNFACPFCHDSATDNRKKRAHLLLNGKWAGRFKCFNCGQSMTFQKFFAEFEQNLSLSDINYISKNYVSDPSSINTSTNNITAQVINKDEALQWAIDRTFVRDALQLREISKEATPFAYQYLVNRCQYSNYDRYLYSDKYRQIIILNLVDNKVLGMQIRSIDPYNKGPKYLTMTIEKMRQALLGDKTPVPETVSKLSCVFNIYNVDFAHTYVKPVLVTEGPFDAFLLPNCIATAGASKNFKMNFPFWYIYDNDETGQEHSIEMLKQGYKTFQWKKFKEDYGIPQNNPYISSGNKKKWDVTDVMKYIRDYKIEKKIYWSPYFTNSMLDGLSV